MNRTWHDVELELRNAEARVADLRHEWDRLKIACAHQNLPKRKRFEEHRDTCPDCGFVTYLMRL